MGPWGRERERQFLERDANQPTLQAGECCAGKMEALSVSLQAQRQQGGREGGS